MKFVYRSMQGKCKLRVMCLAAEFRRDVEHQHVARVVGIQTYKGILTNSATNCRPTMRHFMKLVVGMIRLTVETKIGTR